MIIRFDIYDMTMRETVADALLANGFTEDNRRSWTKPRPEPDSLIEERPVRTSSSLRHSRNRRK
jgi:hypothetical protein